MGMKLDAPVATNALDSSGEVLSIQGLDITDFLEGRAVANWEHSNTSEDGAVGHFIYAKKIFSEADCETPRQLSFWRQLGHEFLYGIVELYDDEGHPGAVSIAAMARYFIKRKEKIKIGMSIEGSTLDRDGHLLNRAVARKAAITLTPCNKECWVEFAGDESQPVAKSESVEVVDFEFDSFDDLLTEVAQLNNVLNKNYNMAPSTLTGQAALSREDIGGRVHNTLKAVLRDWDKKKPLREMVKAALPQLTDNFVDHFTAVAQEMALKKGSYPLNKAPASYDGIPDDFMPDQHMEHTKVIAQKKLPNGFTHTVLTVPKVKGDPTPKETTYKHTLHHPDSNEPLAIMKVNAHKNDAPQDDDYGDNIHSVGHVGVHPKYKGKGFGKQLYLAAIAHHGGLHSDRVVSPKAQALWEDLEHNPSLDTQLGEFGEGVWNEDTRHRAYPEKNIYNKKNFPKVKLGKSEVLLPQNIVPFSPIINEQQQALLEGLTIPDSQNQFEVNAAGQKVILREENDGGKQAAFSFLMDKYFGLGEFFPISNHFTYKSKDFTAELMVENSIIQPKDQFHSSLGQMKMDGTLYKLHIADLILGKFSPRTNMSMLFADNKPVCTYTKDIFMYDLTKLKPMNDLMSDMIPLEIIGWLESKSSNNLKLQMSLLGLSRNQINQAVQIKSIIEMNRHQTLGNIMEAIANGGQSEVKPEFSPDLLQ